MLTNRQKEILQFIKKHQQLFGYPPTYREIGKGVGLSSTASVWEQIKRLEDKGYLKVRDSKPRSIEVIHSTAQNEGEVRIPLMGEVAAGAPIQVYEDEENLVIPKCIIAPERRENFFALEVRGDSMIEEGIMEGDYIICEPAHEVKNGDVVVALVDGDQVTLKKYYRERNFIRLMPANSKMKPILSRNVEVQAVVRAVIRKY